MIKKLLYTNPYNLFVNLILVVIRILSSIFMLTHGLPKFIRLLNGNFKFLDPIGLGSELTFIMAVFAEFLCSIFLIFGIASRISTLPLIATMLVALIVVHSGKSYAENYNIILYLLSYFTILALGPGKYSLDYLFTKKSSQNL